MNRKSKSGWDIRLETHIKNLLQQVKMVQKKNKTKQNTRGYVRIKREEQHKTMQHEELNKKVLANGRSLKRS